MKSFLYLHSPDLAASRRFYGDLIGLDEIFYSDEIQTVGYRVGTMQLTIAAHDRSHQPEGWARQLGWEGGTDGQASWGFELDGERFAAAVAALLVDEAAAWRSEPTWVGYWSFPVRDLGGNTVELTTPNEASWPQVGSGAK